MPAEVPMGSENTKPDGYTQVKTPQGWRLKTHLVAEEMLGRPLRVTERVKCLNRDARTNPTPDNILVVEVRYGPRRLEALDKRLGRLEEEVKFLRSELDRAREPSS